MISKTASSRSPCLLSALAAVSASIAKARSGDEILVPVLKLQLYFRPRRVEVFEDCDDCISCCELPSRSRCQPFSLPRGLHLRARERAFTQAKALAGRSAGRWQKPTRVKNLLAT